MDNLLEDVLADPAITCRAKGLYATLSVLYGNAEITKSDMNALFPDGNASIFKAIDELMAYGLLHREARKVNGRMAGVFYTISPRPRAECQTMRKTVYVYIMYNPDSGLYKIGLSSNPRRRLKNIISSSGAPVVLLKQVQHSDYNEIESFMHSRLSEYKVIGEWFDMGMAPDRAVAIFDALVAEYGE